MKIMPTLLLIVMLAIIIMIMIMTVQDRAML